MSRELRPGPDTGLGVARGDLEGTFSGLSFHHGPSESCSRATFSFQVPTGIGGVYTEVPRMSRPRLVDGLFVPWQREGFGFKVPGRALASLREDTKLKEIHELEEQSKVALVDLKPPKPLKPT